MPSSNGKQGKEVTLPLNGKGGEKIPTESPKTNVDLKVRKYPIGSGKT